MGSPNLLDTLTENNAITNEGGCSIYALAAAINLLVPERKEEIPLFFSRIINIPFGSTPLVKIAVRHGLGPLLNSDNGGTFATAWIAEGFGDPLEEMFNTLFKDAGFPITIFHKFHPLLAKASGEISNPVLQDIIKYCKEGAIALIPTLITQTGCPMFKHHLSLAYIDESWRIFDINLGNFIEIPDQILSQLINDPHPSNSIPYINNLAISVELAPVIFAKRNDN